MKLEDAVTTLLERDLPAARIQEVQWSRGRTRVIQAGSGEDVLLVHGGLGDAFAWIPILPALARRFRVYAVDLPGHGLADGFDFRGSNLLQLMSDFLEEVIEGLHLRSPGIVASSLGASFSIAHSLDHPGHISRIAALGMPGGYKRGVPFPLRMLGLPLVGQPLGRLVMSKPTEEGNRKFWGQILVAHPERIDSSVLHADVASQTRNKQSQLSFLASALGAGGLRSQMMLGSGWEKVPVPVLLLWGDKDVYGRHTEGERLVERSPNLSLVVIPDAGHLPWFDAPERVVTEIERFLTAVG
jgi:2-hydroxy-6-oxonona-2,4-dienedioate hydrolase